MQQLDYGLDKATGLAAMVQYARSQGDQGFERYLQRVRGMTFKQFVASSEGLGNASNYGFAPIDCVRERIAWSVLRKKHSVRDLVEWGMNFETAAKVGLNNGGIRCQCLLSGTCCIKRLELYLNLLASVLSDSLALSNDHHKWLSDLTDNSYRQRYLRKRDRPCTCVSTPT